jgi:hypothetical protein
VIACRLSIKALDLSSASQPAPPGAGPECLELSGGGLQASLEIGLKACCLGCLSGSRQELRSDVGDTIALLPDIQISIREDALQHCRLAFQSSSRGLDVSQALSKSVSMGARRRALPHHQLQLLLDVKYV